MNSRTVGRPEPEEIPSPWIGYIQRVPEPDPVIVCAAQIEDTATLLRGLSDTEAMYRYGRGKWSIKEVVGHLCDIERIMSYRALRIARGDDTPLPGFDENAYVPAAKFDGRSLTDLVGELRTARGSTLAPDVRRRRLAPSRHRERQTGQRPRARVRDSRPRAPSRRDFEDPLWHRRCSLNMKVAILGTGEVGKSLAAGFKRHGHDVKLGHRDPQESYAGAAQFCEIAVLATPWSGTENAIRLSDPKNVAGKVVIDLQGVRLERRGHRRNRRRAAPRAARDAVGGGGLQAEPLGTGVEAVTQVD